MVLFWMENLNRAEALLYALPSLELEDIFLHSDNVFLSFFRYSDRLSPGAITSDLLFPPEDRLFPSTPPPLLN